MSLGCEEKKDPGRRHSTGRGEEAGKILQAILWSQLVLKVGDGKRGMTRAEPGQKRTVTET